MAKNRSINFERYCQNTEKALKHKVSSALFEAMGYMSDLKHGTLWTCQAEKPAAFSEYEDFIFNKFINIDKNILLSDENRNEILEEIIEKLSTLKDAFLPLYLYNAELSKYADILFFRDSINDNEGITDDFDEDFVEIMKQKCVDSVINSFENEENPEQLTGEILSCLPMNIAQTKYFSIINDSITCLFYENEDKEKNKNGSVFKEKLIQKFYPPSSTHYNDIIPEIYADLKKLREMTAENSGLKIALELYDFLSEETDIILDYADQLLTTANYILLLHLRADITEDLLNNDFAVKDSFATIKTYAETDEFEAYVETLEEVVEENKFLHFAKAMELSDEIKDFITRLGDKPLPQELFAISEEYINASKLFSYNIHDDFDIPAGFCYNAAAEDIKEFVPALKEAMKLCPVKLQKNIRRLFYKEIAIDISPDEFCEIVELSLSSLKTSAERLAVRDCLSYILDQDFDDFDDLEDLED